MNYREHFSVLQNDVLRMVQDLSVLINSTLECKGQKLFTVECGSYFINRKSLKRIGIIVAQSTGKDFLIADEIELLNNQVHGEGIFFTKNPGEEFKVHSVHINNDEPLELSLFLNPEPEQYFDLMMQYCTSDLNMKYIMGYAILLRDFNSDQKVQISVHPENIERIGLHDLALVLKEQQ